MNNINYFIHLLILSLLQIVIVDNIHLGSYFYLNIYILEADRKEAAEQKPDK